MKITTTESITNYYKCERCKIDSDTEDRICPCPRGGCEAYLYGKKIITKQIVSLNELPDFVKNEH